MGEETNTVVTKNEFELLFELLAFIRGHGFADIAMTIHTDKEGVKSVRITEGRKLYFILKS